jgi:hypothetical protein
VVSSIAGQRADQSLPIRLSLPDRLGVVADQLLKGDEETEPDTDAEEELRDLGVFRENTATDGVE